MEKAIKAANFMHSDEEDAKSEFENQMFAFEEAPCSVSDLKSCFKAAQSKLCHPQFPKEDSSGYDMGKYLMEHLVSKAEDMIRDDKARPEDFHETFLDFILALVQAGPLSSHVEFIEVLFDDYTTEFKDFYRSLHGDRLKGIVCSLKKEYRPDATMDPERYYSNTLEHFWRLFVFDGLSEEQVKETQAEFLDLYTYFTTGFGDKGEVMAKAMHDLADDIERLYDREIFENIQSVGPLRQQLEALRKLMLSPQFPLSEDRSKAAKDDLEYVLKSICKQGLLLETYDIIMDLALDLTVHKAGCKETCKHFEAIGYFFYHLDRNDSKIKGNAALYEGVMHKFLQFLSQVDDRLYLTFKFVEPVMRECLLISMKPTENHIRLWIDMIKALLKCSMPLCVYTACYAMREVDKTIKWKKYPEDIKELFSTLCDVTFPKWLTDDQLEKGMENLKKFAECLLDEAKKVGVSKLGMTESMVEFAFHCLHMNTTQAYDLASAVVDRTEFNAKKDKQLMMDTIQRVTTFFEDEKTDWEDEDNRDLGYALKDLVCNCINAVKDGKVFSWEDYDDLIYLVKLSERKMMEASEPHHSIFFDVFQVVSVNIGSWLQTMNETHRLIPIIPCLMRVLDSEEENVQQTAVSQMMMLSRTAGILFARYVDKLVDKFLLEEHDELLYVISNSYEYNMGPVEKRFDELFEHIDSGNMMVRSYILLLINVVAKKQPHLFTEDKVGVMVKEAKEDKTQQVQILMSLGEVAKHHADRMEPFVKDFMNPAIWDPMCAHALSVILQLYALGSEEKAERAVSYWLQRVQTSTDYTEVLVSLSACRLVGFKHRPVMEKHRGTVQHFRDNTTNTDYHTACNALLDVLDGKSVDKIAEELRELQGDVADLEERVTVTENDIAGVKDKVEQQGEQLDDVKNEVTDQGQRLGQVETTVQDTAAKVQEIDGKTLSHAPYWARDVSRLLNVESDADWRLLSLRLGFTNDDLRAWATTSDPCMSMLNEWYATHKTREATHAVLTSLQLLDCQDAAAIVENAMKNAEAVVEDEEFDYATPPEIFLSYQWAHQQEVKLLRQHLEMAGFSCWMDIGQMGGGDKLFEKIDSGIRAAKVVISCVTGKYAKSPNCNREVNLSVNLGKPIIPLLMEKTTWPPPGSMGPIFSEYLFIRFFQRQGEHTPDADARFWPLAKFQELLMQLSVNSLVPDFTVVQPEYKDWWVPVVETVTVDKDRANKQSSSAPATLDTTESAQSPDIFISYQWGKQPQILKLYQRLTSLGYSCWLDIMQMGGGDSLYDKIDRGLRGCKLVLACVTSKYALSANCRREVSLADAVKKPLVPLLLESMAWPPPGPMSPVLTQLLYVDCTPPSLQQAWTGPKWDQLLAVILRHVPNSQIQTDMQQDSKVSQPDSKDTNQQPAPQPAPQVDQQPDSKVSQPDSKGTDQQTDPQPVSQKNTAEQPDSEKEEKAIAGQKSAPVAAAHNPPSPPKDRPASASSHDQEKKPLHGRKTSYSGSMTSNLGHDGYAYGQQREIVYARASACCVIL